MQFLSQGSLGSYQLSLKLDILNQNTGAGTNNINNQIPELVIITQTSGVMVNEKGTCSTFLGLLTKSDVLEASTQQSYSKSKVSRLVGGGFLDKLKSVAGKVIESAPQIAELVAPLAKDKLILLRTCMTLNTIAKWQKPLQESINNIFKMKKQLGKACRGVGEGNRNIRNIVNTATGPE